MGDNVTNVRKASFSNDKYKKADYRPTEDFPLEVVTLLDVLSRIEIRRQAKLRTVRKEVG